MLATLVFFIAIEGQHQLYLKIANGCRCVGELACVSALAHIFVSNDRGNLVLVSLLSVDHQGNGYVVHVVTIVVDGVGQIDAFAQHDVLGKFPVGYSTHVVTDVGLIVGSTGSISLCCLCIDTHDGNHHQ